MGAQAAGAAISQGAASVDALYQAYRAEYCSPPAYASGELVPTNFPSELKKRERERGEALEGLGPRPQLAKTLALFLSLFSLPPRPLFSPFTFLPAPGFSLTFSLGNCELDAGARSLECVAPSVRYSQSPAVLTGAHVRPAFFSGEVCRASATFGSADRRVIAVLDPKKPKEMPTPAFLATTLADEVVTTFQDAARGAGSAIEAALPGGAAPALFGGPGGGAATTTTAVGGADAGVAATSAGGRK